MGQVGFGAYRISNRSGEHKEALIAALKFGCPLIDTSSNYTNGESEELIGNVLLEYPEFKPIIITKAGYVQGNNLKVLEELNAKGLALEDLVDLGDSLKHSIHPDFLENQISNSLRRLQKDSIDTFLLHNPEYYFKTEGATQDEYYRRIKKSFEYLESEVKKGRIKNYGISSNTFISPLSDPDVTNLIKVLEVAKKISLKNHFKVIQFPFNLIEIGALEKFGDYGDESLLDLARLNNLTTISNRPLNAFTNDGHLVRLATYDFMTNTFNQVQASLDFDLCMKLIEEKWIESTKDDELSDAQDFDEIVLIKQFKEMWKTLPTPDAVEQVYFGHLFPFIARLWGGNGLSPEQSEPFYKLLEHSNMFSRINMSKKAQEFKNQAISVGLITEQQSRDFATEVIETYLDYGIDFVLVGMKKVEYVNQLKHLFIN